MDVVALGLAKADAARKYRNLTFDPTREVAGLVSWMNPRKLAALPDGTPVSHVPDGGLYGVNYNQNVASLLPTKQTVGGVPCLAFTATNRLEANQGTNPVTSDAAPAQPFTLVAVVRTSNTTTYSMPVGSTSTSKTGRILIAPTGGAYLYAGANGANTAPVGAEAPAFPVNDGKWHVLVAQASTLESRILLDGSVSALLTNQAHGTDGMGKSTIGSDLTSTSAFVGNIGDVMVINGIPPVTVLERLVDYLGSFYGISTASPRDAVLYEDRVISGQSARIFRPRTPAAKRTVVLFSHAHAANERITADPVNWNYWLMNTVVRNGWTWAASAMHGDAWANETAMTDLAALFASLNADAPIDNVILAGGSMGGAATLLAYARNLVPNIKGAYLIDGVADLANMQANATYQASVNTAYSGDYTTNSVGHDPILRATSDYAGKRLRFVASTADTSVPKANHADAMAAKISGVATEAAVVTHANGHLNPDAVKVADFTAFVRRCIA